MFIFNQKLKISNLIVSAKTMENANFRQVFLGTMILHLQTYSKWGRTLKRYFISKFFVYEKKIFL